MLTSIAIVSYSAVDVKVMKVIAWVKGFATGIWGSGFVCSFVIFFLPCLYAQRCRLFCTHAQPIRFDKNQERKNKNVKCLVSNRVHVLMHDLSRRNKQWYNEQTEINHLLLYALPKETALKPERSEEGRWVVVMVVVKVEVTENELGDEWRTARESQRVSEVVCVLVGTGRHEHVVTDSLLVCSCKCFGMYSTSPSCVCARARVCVCVRGSMSFPLQTHPSPSHTRSELTLTTITTTRSRHPSLPRQYPPWLRTQTPDLLPTPSPIHSHGSTLAWQPAPLTRTTSQSNDWDVGGLSNSKTKISWRRRACLPSSESSPNWRKKQPPCAHAWYHIWTWNARAHDQNRCGTAAPRDRAWCSTGVCLRCPWCK